MDFYNLDMVISVGCRVKSLIATRFRIWATQRLKEYIIKGFVIDDERLKNPPVPGSAVPDYFDGVLSHAGKVSKQEANHHAKLEYDQFADRKRCIKKPLGRLRRSSS